MKLLCLKNCTAYGGFLGHFLQILEDVKIGAVLIYDVRGQEVLPIMPRHEWRCAMFSCLVRNLDSNVKPFKNGQ